MPITVIWADPNEYSKQQAKKQEIQTDVEDAPETTAAEKRGATEAIIRLAPSSDSE